MSDMTTISFVARSVQLMLGGFVFAACGNKPIPKIESADPVAVTAMVPAGAQPTQAPVALTSAVDGKLVGVGGAPVQLASTWSAKPTIVVFYRGFF